MKKYSFRLMLFSMLMLTVNGCGRMTMQIRNTGSSSAIIAEDTSTKAVSSEAYFKSLAEGKGKEASAQENAGDYDKKWFMMEESEDDGRFRPAGQEPFYEYALEDTVPLGETEGLYLSLYYDEETKEGSGVLYNYGSEGEKIGFLFDRFEEADWMETDLYTWDGAPVTEQKLDNVEEVKVYDGSGKLICYEYTGDVTDWRQSNEKAMPRITFQIEYDYRKDGTLWRKRGGFDGREYRITSGSKTSYFDELGRETHSSEYVSHGSLDKFYIYKGDANKPIYCFIFDCGWDAGIIKYPDVGESTDNNSESLNLIKIQKDGSLRMIFLNGKIMNTTDYGQSLRVIKKKIMKTLEKKEIDPEMVISAADRLYNDVLNGKFDRKVGAVYAADTERAASAAKLLSAQSLRKKVETELSGTPEHTGGGKMFLRVPIGVLLHIAAGNMEALPAYSVLEGLLARNINILKLPSGDNGISLFLLKKLTEYEPRLTEYIYILDTPSGDVQTMARLMELSGAVAVWGSDETIKSVRRMAPPNVKIIEWGHKLGFAYIEDLKVPDKEMTGLARHIFATDQLLCSSCQVIYLNTDDFEEVKAFGRQFAEVMKREGGSDGNPLFLQGRITVELLTRKLERAGGQYCCYEAGRGSVTCLGDDKLELSGQYGNVLVKPLPRERLFKSLYPHRGYLQTAGIYPKNGELIRFLARCGLTNLYGLDEMGQIMIPGAHDGAFALREYSRIVEYSTESV